MAPTPIVKGHFYLLSKSVSPNGLEHWSQIIFLFSSVSLLLSLSLIGIKGGGIIWWFFLTWSWSSRSWWNSMGHRSQLIVAFSWPPWTFAICRKRIAFIENFFRQNSKGHTNGQSCRLCKDITCRNSDLRSNKTKKRDKISSLLSNSLVVIICMIVKLRQAYRRTEKNNINALKYLTSKEMASFKVVSPKNLVVLSKTFFSRDLSADIIN